MKSRSCEVMRSAPGSDLRNAFEPDDRFDVEVVRRLVEQQDVGTAEQHARHGHAHLPAARERAHVAVDPLVVEPEAVEHLARLALERVAAEVLVLLLHLAEAREDRGPCRRRAPGSAIACCSSSSSWCSVPDAPAAGDGFVEHASGPTSPRRPGGSSRSSASSAPTRRRRRALPRPTIMRKSVVLPAPFGPTSPTFSPGLSWNDASTKSTWRPYCLLMRENEIILPHGTWSGAPCARGAGRRFRRVGPVPRPPQLVCVQAQTNICVAVAIGERFR